jgi:hypothetical protein
MQKISSRTIILAILASFMVAGCSHGPSITEAVDACRLHGKNSSNVSFNAILISYGWALHVDEKSLPPTSHTCFHVGADFGDKTPMIGFPIRVEGDGNLAHHDLPALNAKLTLVGTFICTDPKAPDNDENGHFVPSKILFEGRPIAFVFLTAIGQLASRSDVLEEVWKSK